MKRSPKSRPFVRARLRRRHVERLIGDRYQTAVPLRASLPYVRTVAECCAAIILSEGRALTIEALSGQMEQWCLSWAPAFKAGRINTECASVALLKGWLPPDHHVGDRLKLSLSERDRIGITTIAPSNVTADQWAEERASRKRDKDRTKAAKRREQNGALPRSRSLSRTKPWDHYGITRRTWERRGKPVPPA